MNRILKLGLLSVIVGALYSCSSDSLYDPDKAGDVKLAQYEAAFVGKYGAIASNQNWGFGGTTTRSSNPNSNQWKDFVEVPSSDDLTSEKINKIVELFKDPSKATVIESVNWSDFFVQHVYYGNKDNMINWLYIRRRMGLRMKFTISINQPEVSCLCMTAVQVHSAIRAKEAPDMMNI